MKILIDNNLSYKLIDHLKSAEIQSFHIKNVLSVFSLDQEIWDYAKDHKCMIMTKDNDFDELSQLFGCPPKVVHLLCGNKSTSYIADFIMSNKSSLIDFYESNNENCLLKLSD
ncbi:MAG TPA: DUF5615 family PIN-like protein [Gracilimonas sp.]|uniref:DUF5615 family PIN-like protein n=1 Tax=Gracilimonas sp. TaxID=1974203 RepID=UPI002D94F0FB|nr:DUF5615 family PIN-like protein [Gracilimonas sp.]